jgi:hypothetical protein
MTKIAGSGSESIIQKQGSEDPDPDPPQNVMDPEHWTIVCHLKLILLYQLFSISSKRDLVSWSIFFLAETAYRYGAKEILLLEEAHTTLLSSHWVHPPHNIVSLVLRQVTRLYKIGLWIRFTLMRISGSDCSL